MRIGAGTLRGRTLRTPRGEATRPTSGMVRETLFNILAPELPDSTFLDLYAGCGSVGLEAVSRGAAHATLVEKATPALACLRANVAALELATRITVLPTPVERALDALRGTAFDIVFLDPPFADLVAYQHVLDKVSTACLLYANGVLIAQHGGRDALPERVGTLVRVRVKKIGDNALTFYRVHPTAGERESGSDAKQETMLNGIG